MGISMNKNHLFVNTNIGWVAFAYSRFSKFQMQLSMAVKYNKTYYCLYFLFNSYTILTEYDTYLLKTKPFSIMLCKYGN